LSKKELKKLLKICSFSWPAKTNKNLLRKGKTFFFLKVCINFFDWIAESEIKKVFFRFFFSQESNQQFTFYSKLHSNQTIAREEKNNKMLKTKMIKKTFPNLLKIKIFLCNKNVLKNMLSVKIICLCCLWSISFYSIILIIFKPKLFALNCYRTKCNKQLNATVSYKIGRFVFLTPTVLK
jgi:hypothetical protein